MQQKQLIISALLAAMCIAVGYLFLYVPNFEFFMGMIFISGFLVGPRYGVLIGIVATLVFSGLNPLGMAAPPLFITQIICYAFTGFCGGVMNYLKLENFSIRVLAPLTAMFGMLLTILYDVLTTLGFALFLSDMDWRKIVAIFVSGLAFYGMHLLINTLSFTILVPVLMNRLAKFRVSHV